LKIKKTAAEYIACLAGTLCGQNNALSSQLRRYLSYREVDGCSMETAASQPCSIIFKFNWHFSRRFLPFHPLSFPTSFDPIPVNPSRCLEAGSGRKTRYD